MKFELFDTICFFAEEYLQEFNNLCDRHDTLRQLLGELSELRTDQVNLRQIKNFLHHWIDWIFSFMSTLIWLVVLLNKVCQSILLNNFRTKILRRFQMFLIGWPEGEVSIIHCRKYFNLESNENDRSSKSTVSCFTF